ncbi:TetR/AcrR family transcriptional regulator [Mongoliimonas terrestris]|uniref:TetR/AcrR family transcriptional regulator n=1 Tax=Mongoliimonas terrestris TaxID=1709001 RepID=UPI0009496BDC|nr:TetR family transcriptional regulator [Mongoliimonas terrestris]
MRVSRSQAAENRQTVIDVASRLFRQHGFDGIGLKDLMEAAGLTQGAFYKQFESKEDLAVHASERALERTAERWETEIAAHPEDPLGAVLSLYLSQGHRSEVAEGCPIVALGADAIRHGGDVKRSFAAGVRNRLNRLRDLIGETHPQDADSKALAVASLMIGGLMLTRLFEEAELADAVLEAASEAAREIASG